MRSQKSDKYFLEQKEDKENNTNILEVKVDNNNLTNAQLEKAKFNILKEPIENKIIYLSTKQRLINNINCITSTSPSLESDLDLLKTPKSIQSSRHYLVDCTTEDDSEGFDKCVEWQRGGFCKTHPATKWLFCRRQCLCF
uniref:ShKT domain-containing protein n=1 Tax=Meloidogyne incognita TaxID=6306 RepID=A0A914NP99_MELIC